MRNIVATGNYYGHQMTVKQISKARARRLFAQGKKVFMQSCNMYPFGMWQSMCDTQLDKDQLIESKKHYDWCIDGNYPLPVHPATAEGQFDMVCNDYSYYNTDSERGKYISFYEDITPR